MVDVINESLTIARKTQNPNTRAERITTAKNTLHELKELANKYPFLAITSLAEVEKSIENLDDNYCGVSSGEMITEMRSGSNSVEGSPKDESPERSSRIPQTAEESTRWHNERMGKLLANDNYGVIKGFVYCATLQLRTPLRILSLDGTLWKNGIPPESDVPWHGIWVPQIKTWNELGFNIKEMPESDSSSDIGYVKRSEYLPFLKDIRRAVEIDESVRSRVESLRLVMRKKEYAKFVKRHQGQNQIIDFYFPLLLNSMPGVSSSVASALRESKITTIRQLRKKTDKDLLSIKGVGINRDTSPFFSGKTGKCPYFSDPLHGAVVQFLQLNGNGVV